MDIERKRHLKALGKAEVARRSSELQARLAEANSASTGSDAWVVGYRRGVRLDRWLKRRLPILHEKRLKKLFVVAPFANTGWVPTIGGYLLCLGCGSALPSDVPPGRIKWGKCRCANVRWRLFFFWGGIDVKDHSLVEPVKLIAKG